MERLLSALAGLSLLAGCSSPHEASASGPVPASAAREPRSKLDTLRAEIEQANVTLMERFRAGDHLGVAQVYCDDAVLLGPGGSRIEGRKAIDDYWTGIHGGRDWLLEVREVGGDGDLAWQRGRSTLVTQRDGDKVTSVVDFMLIWRREADRGWRIAVDAYWHAAR